MTAPNPAVDRPMPMVAIVGNDAVLAAAPATPVQVAHACLRRGFAVAVPASWGDELVAAEAVRTMTSRARGPAVMCVCPFVRSRLLGPGPDLAAFLVSLVPPPVAAARYVRTVYGGRAVHVTYIGACPGADDPSIDARLTPDDFIADLAEHGIALSEQPLVFDSIVPPDRRRWCSLPGGVPSADVLWSETDGRACIEIERGDIPTDLAQLIMAREHALLDLAPGLGCACSGATGLVPADRARAAVTAAEPPRALSPVIDPAAVISLRLPIEQPGTSPPVATLLSDPPQAAPADPTLERILDAMLGDAAPGFEPSREVEVAARSSELEWRTASAVIVDVPDESVPGPSASVVPAARPDDSGPANPSGDRTTISEMLRSEPDVATDSTAASELDAAVESVPDAEPVVTDDASRGAVIAREDDSSSADSRAAAVVDMSRHDPGSVAIDNGAPSPRGHVPAEESSGTLDSPVRRRTPSGMLVRHPAASLPKATGADGRPLPRAYVAKRRTPPAGAPVILATRHAETTASALPLQAVAGPAPATPDDIRPTPDRGDGPNASVDATPPGPSAPPAIERAAPSASNASSGPVAAPAANQSALMIVLVGLLVALGAFVLAALRR